MEYVYIPKGVCSSKMTFDIVDEKVMDLKVEQGCAGNLAGISKLIKGQNIDEIIEKLEGIPCGFKRTSCPDQIARALKMYKEKRNI